MNCLDSSVLIVLIWYLEVQTLIHLHIFLSVQESSLVANEIASTQMRDLEKSAFGVMRTPGPDKEHVCIRDAHKQLQVFSKIKRVSENKWIL